MNGRSLSFKLFTATSLALVGLIMMILQLVFFERYYEHQKSAAFKRDFNALMQKLKEMPDLTAESRARITRSPESAPSTAAASC